VEEESKEQTMKRRNIDSIMTAACLAVLSGVEEVLVEMLIDYLSVKPAG